VRGYWRVAKLRRTEHRSLRVDIRPTAKPGPELGFRSYGRGMSNTSVTTLDDTVFERLLRERIIVLGQEVDDGIANRIIAQLLLLAAEDPAADITLYINSPGGSVSAGLAIYDTMQAVAPDVATIATGLAASMGQFLLTGGAPGKRGALAHAEIMMHQPHGGVGGVQSDIRIRANMLSRLKRQILDITAQHTGQPFERVEADAERDRWFTPAQAVEYGLVDRVLTRS
jgi:ATP-dependent Clp protease, protease subunit